MRRSGVRIPLAPPEADIRSGCRFLYAWVGRRRACRCVALAPLVFRALRCAALWDLAAVCAGGRRPAREIATREPAARSGRSRGPPWPCRRPPAPRPGPAGPAAASNRAGLVVPLVFRAPEGPAAREARRPHFVRRRASKPARALRSLRRPLHRQCLVTVSSLARPRHRPRAPQPGPPVPPASSTPAAPGCCE